MDKIYDVNNSAYGYEKEGKIYDKHHHLMGYVKFNAVYDKNNNFLGCIEDCVVYNKYGCPIGYTNGYNVLDLKFNKLGYVHSTFRSLVAAAGLLLLIGGVFF